LVESAVGFERQDLVVECSMLCAKPDEFVPKLPIVLPLHVAHLPKASRQRLPGTPRTLLDRAKYLSILYIPQASRPARRMKTLHKPAVSNCFAVKGLLSLSRVTPPFQWTKSAISVTM